MPNTFTLISTTTVGAGGAASIDFTSIPQTYTDLQIVFSVRTNRGDNVLDSVNLSFNGSTANRTARQLRGNGSTAGSSSDTNIYWINGNTATSNTFASGQIYIPNYAGSTNKSASIESVSENNATEAGQGITAMLWSQTAAITSLGLAPISSSLFLQYSTASLYGILKGSGGATVS